MGHTLVCWKCGASLAALSLPLLRRDECPACHAMCVDYDESLAKRCREPTAEEVSDKTRANFCGHFAPRGDAYRPRDSAAATQSLSELEKLFGKR